MVNNYNDLDLDAIWPGKKGLHLVLSNKEFIVFVDHDLDVDWETSDEYDKKGHKDEEKHGVIMNLAAELECIPNVHHPKTIRLNFKRMIGEAISRSFKGEYQNAEDMINKAYKYISRRNLELSRYWYLCSSIMAGFLCIFLGVLFWLNRLVLSLYLGETAFYLFLAAFGGGLGALLSIILRVGNVRLDSSAGKKLHYMEGGARILAGSISGVIISFFINLKLILPILTDKMHLLMVAFSIIAGASERFVPTIITYFDKDTSNSFQIKNSMEEKADDEKICSVNLKSG